MNRYEQLLNRAKRQRNFSGCKAAILSCMNKVQLKGAERMVQAFKRLHSEASTEATRLEMLVQERKLHIGHVDAIQGVRFFLN